MEIFDNLEGALEKYPDAKIAHAQIGDCMVCKKRQDLRCGACFNCLDKVTGKPIKDGHRLWEKENPDNTWYVGN